jgi:hypothetical protein
MNVRIEPGAVRFRLSAEEARRLLAPAAGPLVVELATPPPWPTLPARIALEEPPAPPLRLRADRRDQALCVEISRASLIGLLEGPAQAGLECQYGGVRVLVEIDAFTRRA